MNKSTKVILGIAAGIALTVVSAVLIEPGKVKKFSKKATKKGKKLWKETKEAADELVQRGADISANIKDAVEDATEKVIKGGREFFSNSQQGD